MTYLLSDPSGIYEMCWVILPGTRCFLLLLILIFLRGTRKPGELLGKCLPACSVNIMKLRCIHTTIWAWNPGNMAHLQKWLMTSEGQECMQESIILIPALKEINRVKKLPRIF